MWVWNVHYDGGIRESTTNFVWSCFGIWPAKTRKNVIITKLLFSQKEKLPTNEQVKSERKFYVQWLMDVFISTGIVFWEGVPYVPNIWQTLHLPFFSQLVSVRKVFHNKMADARKDTMWQGIAKVKANKPAATRHGEENNVMPLSHLWNNRWLAQKTWGAFDTTSTVFIEKSVWGSEKDSAS